MFKNKEGQRVPKVTFRTRKNGEWVNTDTDKIFKNKTVVVFSLPGAYTPTCSSAHVPGYNEFAPAMRKCGVDEIACVSVNDAFVMSAWQKDQQADGLTFIPDGNGEFTEKLGMLVDKSDLGFGKRSWRYSMLVKNGVIKKMFIEPDKPGDPYEVSDAETMLKYLNPKAARPPRITVFTKKGCPYCAKAKKMLKDRALRFEEIEIGGNVSASTLYAVAGKDTVPQVFVDGHRVGGSDDLEKYIKKGGLS